MDITGLLVLLAFLYALGLVGAIIITVLAALTSKGGIGVLQFLVGLPVSITLLVVLSTTLLDLGCWQSFGLAVLFVGLVTLSGSRAAPTGYPSQSAAIRGIGSDARKKMDKASDVFLQDILDISRR